MSIVFFGSSGYCLPVLEALKSQLVQIVTRPDKPEGRKKILIASPVKAWAIKNKIDFVEDSGHARMTGVDLGIVADFGQILPEEIFQAPKLGTFNIHFSKLPDLRGASPVQSAILRGDTTAWITVFKLEKTLDTGPVLDQRSFPILPDDTAASLYTRLFNEVAKYITTLNFSAKLSPQTGTPTFCRKLSRDNGFIEYSRLLEPITYNLYRAMTPWPGLWTLRRVHGEPDRTAQGRLQRMKILKCHPEDDRLVLDEIQLEGQKPLTGNIIGSILKSK